MVKRLLKLNIGSGLITPYGWVNIDSSWNARLAKWPKLRKILGRLHLLPVYLVEIPWPSNITVFDVRKGLPYLDNSVKFIYASHLFEHLSRLEARKLLKESYRVLVPGGVIRIIVPDLLLCAKNYLENFQKYDRNSKQLPPAENFLESLQMYDQNLVNQPFWLKFYKMFHDKNTHKWMYDLESLSYLLRMTGFKDISEKRFSESIIEDIIQLDQYDRFQNSICLEAIK